MPGETFPVDVNWANIQPVTCTDPEKENCKEYTVTLKAVYGDVELASKTTIQYCDRLATPECGQAITVNVNDKFKLAEEPAKVD